MMTELKRTHRDYPLSFKIAVVEQVEKGEMTYKQALQRYGIQGRFTVLVWLRKYGRLDCYQNALAERINGILKNEFLLSRPGDLVQAWKMVKESVAIYSYERPHLALKYKTPDDVHQAFYRQKTVNLYQD
ncbi:integrase core domain-containing protein [Citrobacter enshiensis]|uniref:integrase core domain-containing protein n=1 Tax=Citrobacter enshiensis TaxID=2971264 RepID=UPI003898F84A